MPIDFLDVGLRLAGFRVTPNQRSLRPKLERFRAWYGCLPETASQIFQEIQDDALGDDCITKPIEKYFFMTLCFLRTYRVEAELAGTFEVSEKYVRKYVWKYIRAMRRLKPRKIIWKWNNNVQPFPNYVFIVSVDGTHCPINEPRLEPSSTYFSHKLNRAGLTYEVALCLRESKIVWTHGPYPAGKNDISMYRRDGSGLKHMIPHGKKVIADRGYAGEDEELSTPNVFDNIVVKNFKRRARARQETINFRFKSYRILATPFRHGKELHRSVFETVAVIVQTDMDNGLSLFEI